MPLRQSLAAAALLLSRLACVGQGFTTRALSRETASPEVLQDKSRFRSPQLTPRQFLFISSPKERKVVYTELNNFQSSTGRVFALVDSGLVEPAGLAFDRMRGSLYIADRGANRIFRYRVLHKESNGRQQLVTDGVQLCIIQGTSVEWVAVDPATGDLFYSDEGTKTINKVPADVLRELATGQYQCGDIAITSEKVRMVQAAAAEKKFMQMTAAQREAALPTDAPNTQPLITELYEGKVNPHVSTPGGVVSDGVRLYWTNKKDGKEAGTAVVGETRPELDLASELETSTSPFPALALTNETDEAHGIAKSNTMVFYSTNSTGSGSVYGVMEDGHAHAFVTTLVEPRGLVWDGDNTVYVADQATSMVWSFPVGRLMEDAPLTRSVPVQGAFGLALFSAGDAAFDLRDAAPASRNWWFLHVLLVLAAVYSTAA